ncbi:MAG: SGNH/GDSL hydrolase family protein [Vicinamibacteria bacterium]|nr:SGNH/GDSL hydrolase family protein [Vicinamibacteria bacterium]
MRGVWILALGLLLPVATASADPASKALVPIADIETVVFYGDSITEQNLYSAYIETFLLSRFPQKKIACFNFGWSGDTARGGQERFARDVAPVKPSLVFVNFGMNDGGYQSYDEAVQRRYIEAQRALAATIETAGARQVFLTASPVDEYVRGDQGVYNDTLAHLGRGVVALAGELDKPAIDIFQPMRDIMRLAHERDSDFTLIPDSIHPDPAGHLVMAYLALRGIDAPREVGEIIISEGRPLQARGVSVDHVATYDGGLEFDMTPPFLPFYVPPSARKALELVPLQEELNRFRLRVEDETEARWVLAVDGASLGTFTTSQLRDGVDLALLDKAPWCLEGRTLWETAQLRWQKHREAWRTMGLEKPKAMMPDLPSFGALALAQRAYADDLGRFLTRLAQPRSYHVGLWRAGDRVSIAAGELSPAYAYDGFDEIYPPESDPEAVNWTIVPFENGVLDLAKHLNAPMNVVAYVRVVLEAESPSVLHLALGSDDGVAVLVNGKSVFAHDVARSLKPGEDETEIALVGGRNEILFKVTQGAGHYALAVEADVRGHARVRQRLPD